MLEIKDITEQVADARAPLRIIGGDTKRRFGHVDASHDVLHVAEYAGVMSPLQYGALNR